MELFLLGILGISIGQAAETIGYNYFKKLNRKTVFWGVTFWTMLAFLLTAGIFAWVGTPELFQNITVGNVATLALLAVIMLVQITLWLQTVKYIKVSLADPITNLELVLTTTLSWVLFGDKLSAPEIVLLVVIVGLVVWLGLEQNKWEQKTALKTPANSKNKFWIGFGFLMIWTALSVVAQLLNKTLILNEMHPVTTKLIYYAFGFLYANIVMLFLFFKQKKKQLPSTKNWKTIFTLPAFKVVALANVLSGVLYLTLIKDNNIGLVSALTNLGTVFVMFYGVLIFKEKISKLSYAILAGILVSASVLSYLISVS